MIVRLLLVVSTLVRQSQPQSSAVLAVCGTRKSNRCPTKVNLRVTNGANSCAERVPWNVLIENKNKGSQGGGVFPHCGGVLITEKHILSAAHCFFANRNEFGLCSNTRQIACLRVKAEDILVHLGVTDRMKITARGHDVSSIDIHPGWNRTAPLNDILEGHDLALLTMARPQNSFSKLIIPICLPDFKKSFSEPGSSGLVSGFGAHVDKRTGSKSYPTILQTARVELHSRRDCVDLWDIEGSQVCAIGRSPISGSVTNPGSLRVSDSCNGDSGGGLTTQAANGRETLIGIVSFGEPECGRLGGKPGVYTNVANHVDWIKKSINQIPEIPLGSKVCTVGNGKRCQFPFRYREKVFASCTREFDNDNKPWCSTKTDKQGNHVIGEDEWGHCPSSCPVDIQNPPGFTSNPNPNPGGESWSKWSPCSKTCGQGTRIRSNNLCPRTVPDCVSRETETCFELACPSVVEPKEWSSWSSCSTTCGQGQRTRTLTGSRVTQERGCNNKACSDNSNSNSNNNNNNQDFQELWIVGGTDEENGYIESFKPNKNGRISVSEVGGLGLQRDAAMGAAVDGRVYVCGGSSGDYGDSKVHNTCFTKLARQKGRGWQYAASMPLNTSHAAYTSHNKKFYVLGGYVQPLCGYKPQVQVFDHDRQEWSAPPSFDPPKPLGGYACAVTHNQQIFVTGGYYTDDVYTTACKEDESEEEKTVSNRNIENYVDYVQIFSPRTSKWKQAPTMNNARRNHGCAVVNYKGQQGLLVVGGYNSKKYFLKSVEFLSFKPGSSWVELPPLQHLRGSKVGVISDSETIYVVSGDLDGKGRLVETLPTSGGQWNTVDQRLLKEKSYACYIPV